MKTDKVKEGAGKNPKWCKSNHSPPPTSRLVPNQSQNNGCFGKTKPTAFIVEHDVFWNELSFWSAILFMFLLPCCPSAACLWRDGAQWEISKHCSMTAETPVCYQCCYSHRYKTQHYMGCCEESYSIPARPNTHYSKSLNYCFSSAVLELLLFVLLILCLKNYSSFSQFSGLKGKACSSFNLHFSFPFTWQRYSWCSENLDSYMGMFSQ